MDSRTDSSDGIAVERFFDMLCTQQQQRGNIERSTTSDAREEKWTSTWLAVSCQIELSHLTVAHSSHTYNVSD